jgi:hypothetical protein
MQSGSPRFDTRARYPYLDQVHDEFIRLIAGAAAPSSKNTHQEIVNP